MEIFAFSIFFLCLVKKILVEEQFFDLSSPGLPLLFLLFAALISLALFQMLTMPEGLLKLISPSSLSQYSTFGNYATGAFHPISLNPDATRRELFRVLAYAAIFFVIVSHYRTKEQVNSLVRTILYMGFFLVVFAIVQKMTWNGRIFWIYPVDEYLRDGSRIWGPYVSYDNFAGYMEMAIPLGMGLLLYLAPSVKALPESSRSLRLARFLASEKLVPYARLFLLVLIMTAALFMTFSRGGTIAFIVSSLFFAWITYRRRTLRRKTGLLAILAAVLFAAVVLAAWDRLEQRFADLKQDHVSRRSVWQDSLGIVRDYPAWGTGLGTFESAYMRYQTTMPRLFFDHAHNDYVELVTDTGLIGLLLGAGMALVFFRSAFRCWRRKQGMFGKCIGAGGMASCVAIAAHSFTDFNLHIPANALLFAVISALTYAAVFNIAGNNKPGQSDDQSEEPIPSPSTGEGKGEGEKVSPKWRGMLIYPTILLLTFVILSFPIRDLAAGYFYSRVARILDDESTEGRDVLPISEKAMPAYLDAISSLQTAAAIAPSRALYQGAIAELYTRLGKWAETMQFFKAGLPIGTPTVRSAADQALFHLKRAVMLEPTNPDYHLALGRLYDTNRGESDLAASELKKAVAAYPVNAPLRYSVAMQHLLAGRKGDALEQARELARLDDSYILGKPELKTDMVERQTPEYLSMLAGSYLYSALEIAWRVSKDPEVIKGIAPDNPDAARVTKLFLASRRIDE